MTRLTFTGLLTQQKLCWPLEFELAWPSRFLNEIWVSYTTSTMASGRALKDRER